MENAIEVKNLCKKYDSFTLDNVCFALPKGYIMGFIGANGAGKSTTIKLLLGLVHRTSGYIAINGTDIGQITPEDREHIGYVPDGNCLPEVLKWPEIDKIMKECYKTWDSKKFADICTRNGLDRNAKIQDYSKGMKMKINIAVAMCHDSTLLIMDEPTAGLDPLAREELREMLADYVMDGEKSVFLSSHITSDLEKICDYITFVKDGRVIACDEKDSLIDRHALLNCTKEALKEIDSEAVIGVRHSHYGEQALVIREMLPVGKEYALDPATLEDIMIYYNKEER